VDAAIGLAKTALDTPALIVNREAMRTNIARLAQTCHANGIN
jgi:D-serine deaminase-like pyridoxal phosphate-dependent protein